jgi:hypothetical protein
MTVATIDEKRLARVKKLDHGSHDKVSDGMCIMEAAAYVSRLPFSDHPECVCPVIGAFLRSWNDSLPDGDRTALLLPLLPKVLNTRNPALEERRSLMAADWLVRVHTPAWLRLAKLTDQAALLEALPEITSMAQVPSIRAPLEAVRKDAAAAWDAAWDAAWAAARAAAGAAARDAARAAAGAAAWDAAWDAAWAAAWAAARAAAWDALNGTRASLQQSAVQLVERMCALEAA